MTDPDETADLVNGLTRGYRDHRDDEEAQRPVRYNDVSCEHTMVDARRRYDELTERDLTAWSRATLQAHGECGPARHAVLDAGPLTVSEHLEVLANGELLARNYRRPSQVDAAVKAGATWQQIAEARGQTEGQARVEYREWAEGQHKYADMSDADYEAAIERVAGAGAGE
ncbi:MAG TPA: hypothetical protein VHY31_07475 [Streptosporangiaceae bacterium]|jgi:hypothetical protein|nr:hypothetical protein [Streptosporangiaceae bacterium]